MIDNDRRHFWSRLYSDVSNFIHETKHVMDETTRFMDFFKNSDSSYTLSRHYPRELFEDEATRLGIDIDEIGIDEAVKCIFEQQYENEQGKENGL